MQLCERVSGRLPVLPMVYANVVLTLGAERFAAALASAGAAGAIIPDLPRDEDPSVAAAPPRARPCADRVRLADDARRSGSREIAAAAVGFTYVVSLTGVTGERSELPPELAEMVAAVSDASDAPAAVGFGIGTPEQAARVGEIADGVIIGTRLVRARRRCADEPRERPSTPSRRSWQTPATAL